MARSSSEEEDLESRTFHRFVTRPDIDAPAWFIRNYQDRSALSEGYWFHAFYNGLDQFTPGEHWIGPHIYDSNGDLVWSGGPAFDHWNTFDFGVVQVGNEKKLSLISHHDRRGLILNNRYEVEYTVPLVLHDDERADMHAFNVIDQGRRAFVITNHHIRTTREVSQQQIGLTQPCLAEYQGFRELDLTNPPDFSPVFEWDAREWISLNESTYRTYDGTVESMCAKGWDILHLNTIDKFPDGDYLLSARHTDAIYKISQQGHVVWRLGGVKSDFKMLGDSKFSRQHHPHIRLQNETHIIMGLLDNAKGDGAFNVSTYKYSRGLVLSLNTQDMTAATLEEYPHPNEHFINARGSYQELDNGNVFLGWAWSSRFSEHTPDGQIAMQAVLAGEVHSYRSFKHPWAGYPSRPPDLHVEAVRDRNEVLTIIHVSWNGATNVAFWTFNMIEGQNVLRLGNQNRTGFETRFVYAGYAPNIFAEAFDEADGFLGRSEVHPNSPPKALGADNRQMPALKPYTSDYLEHPARRQGISAAYFSLLPDKVPAFIRTCYPDRLSNQSTYCLHPMMSAVLVLLVLTLWIGTARVRGQRDVPSYWSRRRNCHCPPRREGVEKKIE